MALTDQWTGCTPGCWAPDENQAEVDRVVSAGAFVMGRNMLGPIRDDWDPNWRGWWGEDPPYHAPVHQLPRAPLTSHGRPPWRKDMKSRTRCSSARSPSSSSSSGA